jgi:hypothetical protein
MMRSHARIACSVERGTECWSFIDVAVTGLSQGNEVIGTNGMIFVIFTHSVYYFAF